MKTPQQGFITRVGRESSSRSGCHRERERAAAQPVRFPEPMKRVVAVSKTYMNDRDGSCDRTGRMCAPGSIEEPQDAVRRGRVPHQCTSVAEVAVPILATPRQFHGAFELGGPSAKLPQLARVLVSIPYRCRAPRLSYRPRAGQNISSKH